MMPLGWCHIIVQFLDPEFSPGFSYLGIVMSRYDAVFCNKSKKVRNGMRVNPCELYFNNSI